MNSMVKTHTTNLLTLGILQARVFFLRVSILIIFGFLASCQEETESKTYLFRLGTTNYAVDYTDCKVLGNDFKVLAYRRSVNTITDISCELTFYGYTNTPPPGDYEITGYSNNVTQGYVDLVIKGGDLGLTYIATSGTITVKKNSGKTGYSYSGVPFEATGGINTTGFADLKCF